jgi:hypothetical protein
MKKRNWLLGSLRKKEKKGKKNFSEYSEKYRVYVLRDNVSTMFNIVTVIILRGTNLHTKLLSNEGRVPFVGPTQTHVHKINVHKRKQGRVGS